MLINGGQLLNTDEELDAILDLARNEVLQSIPDILFLMNEAGEYLYYKKGDGKTFIDENKIIGSTIQESGMPAEIIHKILSINKIALDTGRSQKVAYSLVFPNDKIRYYESIAVRYNRATVLRIVRDITSRIYAEHELLHIKDNEDRRKAVLNYLVSHQLRSKVATIMGIGALIKENRLSKEDEKLFIQEIFNLLERLDEVIHQISLVLNQAGKAS